MNEPWRTQDLEQERDGLRARHDALDREIAELRRLYERAEAAFGECNRAAQDFANQALALKARVQARGTITGPDGRPFSGATLAERDEYDRLMGEREAVLQRYQSWVTEARIPVTDAGGLDRSWSPRLATDVAARIRVREIDRGMVGNRLRDVEAERAALTPPADPEATGTPASGRGRWWSS